MLRESLRLLSQALSFSFKPHQKSAGGESYVPQLVPTSSVGARRARQHETLNYASKNENAQDILLRVCVFIENSLSLKSWISIPVLM